MRFIKTIILMKTGSNSHFYVSKDFCYSIGDETFKERLLDKIIIQQEEEQDAYGETALLGIRLENRTDDYDGDLIFTGFNQSEEQEEQETVREQQEAVQEKAAQEDTVQEDAVQVADKPNFDPELENTPTVGTETATNVDVNDNVNVAANNNAVEIATSETPQSLRERAISVFLDYLVNHCNEVKHIYLEDEETRAETKHNEKFAMRAWFTQLGWRGKEDNELRSYFYDRLEGNTAFRTEEDHARWAAKWQPRYFEKHPEMKWVLEELEKVELRNELRADLRSEESGKLAEKSEEPLEEPLDTVVTETATEIAQEGQEVQEIQDVQAAQAAQESVEHTEAIETDTDSVSKSVSESVPEPSAEATQEPNTDSESGGESAGEADDKSDCESSDAESSAGESENKNNSQETAEGLISDGAI